MAVYILTSASISDRCKVGMYSNTLNDLKNRYVTAIPDVQIHYFIKTRHADSVERAFKETWKQFRIINVNNRLSEWITLPVETAFQILAGLIMKYDIVNENGTNVIDHSTISENTINSISRNPPNWGVNSSSITNLRTIQSNDDKQTIAASQVNGLNSDKMVELKLSLKLENSLFGTQPPIIELASGKMMELKLTPKVENSISSEKSGCQPAITKLTLKLSNPISSEISNNRLSTSGLIEQSDINDRNRGSSSNMDDETRVYIQCQMLKGEFINTGGKIFFIILTAERDDGPNEYIINCFLKNFKNMFTSPFPILAHCYSIGLTDNAVPYLNGIIRYDSRDTKISTKAYHMRNTIISMTTGIKNNRFYNVRNLTKRVNKHYQTSISDFAQLYASMANSGIIIGSTIEELLS
jgi:hypothetical protein